MGNGMNKIVPGLFVGSINDANNLEKLKENKITHILSIHDKEQEEYPGFNYLRIQIRDNSKQNIIQHFRASNEFIHQARMKGGNVLVHCLAGMSRSVTVTTAYLMVVTNKPWNDILMAIRQRRLVAAPNMGFKLQLDRFEGRQLEEERQWLRNNFGVVDAFGDASRIEALYHEHMTSVDDVTSTSRRREGISKMSVSSNDYFSREMDMLKLDDDDHHRHQVTPGTGSLSNRAQFDEDAMDLKFMKNYQQTYEDAMEE